MEKQLQNITSLANRVKIIEENKQIYSEFIKRNLKEGVDYGIIKFVSKRTGREEQTKPFLFKPGSEKFVMLFDHRAVFTPILEDWETGSFAYKCEIVGQGDKVIGEGRGAAKVSERSSWTANEAIKIAEKRAQIDATLRTYGLSEYFSQDEDSVEHPAIALKQPRLATNKAQADRIVSMLSKLGRKGKNKQEWDAIVLELTQLEMQPENYAEIQDRLEILLVESSLIGKH